MSFRTGKMETYPMVKYPTFKYLTCLLSPKEEKLNLVRE